MKKVKIRICDTVEEAVSLSGDLKSDADDAGRSLWSLGVTYEEDEGVEKTLFVALDYDGTPMGAVMSAVHLLTSMGTLRVAVDKLMRELATEAYIDQETLDLLTAREMEAVLTKEGNDVG